MKLCEINPHVRFARIIQRIPRSITVSRNYDCRLFFVMSGEAVINVNGDEYKISNNNAIFIPPASRYKFTSLSDGVTFCSVNFDLVSRYSDIEASLGTAAERDFDESRVPKYELPAELSHVVTAEAAELRGLLEKCCSELLCLGEYCRESASALIKLCLIDMLRGGVPTAVPKRITEAVIAHIHESYSDPELSNEAVAALVGYHPYYLSGIIKQETGMTLHRYLTEYRLRVAKNYLASTELDIAVIAWKCGFNSAAYFAKLFRESTGSTPREYRRSHGML